MHRRRDSGGGYLDALTAAGFAVSTTRGNDYRFLSDRARDACATYGVESKSVAARKH